MYPLTSRARPHVSCPARSIRPLRRAAALAAAGLVATLGLTGLAAAQTKNAAQEKPADTPSAADSSYSLGVSMGEQLRLLGVTSDMVTTDRLVQGLRDALGGKEKMSEEHQDRITTLVRTARETTGKRNEAAARKFLADNSRRKDVKTTPSGLQYRVIEAGKGKSPGPTDDVTVPYRGTLLDGTEFDSSIARGEPVSFPVNGVIQGWQEALVLMKPGAKWELFIPPELAYGLNSPPEIPPGSLLLFEVELLSVKPTQ